VRAKAAVHSQARRIASPVPHGVAQEDLVMWKKRVLPTLAVVLAAGLALVVVLAARPSVDVAERSVVVAAPPEVVMAQLADPRRWPAWSPWKDGGDGALRSYGGPQEGEGATVYWSGGDGTGRGRLTIIQASVESVEVEREVERPTSSLTDLEFTLLREGAGTRVSWRMKREHTDTWTAARSLLPGGDRAFAGDLDRGLARLKAVSEAQASPRRWRVERSARVAAQPAAVLAQLVDLHRWTDWSPWERPGLPRSFGGPAKGIGASAYWTSDAVERGRLTVVGATSNRVELELELSEPVQSLADLEFTLAQDGTTTRVVWGMAGDVEVSGEALGRAGDPETTIAKDLELGLARLQAVVERGGLGVR
jgi:carbon monoxide dehydrogenase subunit G